MKIQIIVNFILFIITINIYYSLQLLYKNPYKLIKFNCKKRQHSIIEMINSYKFSSSSLCEWDPIEGSWKGNKAVSISNEVIQDLVPFYVFGYGSLIWRPGYILEDLQSYKCQCIDWYRMFSQRSCDHRGTVAFPGLVLTLLHKSFFIDNNIDRSSFDDCIGKIWLIPEQFVQSILDELDYREKGGYERQVIDIKLLEDTPYHKRNTTAKALVYTASPDNPNFYLPSFHSINQLNIKIADIVSVAKGPSGRNIDYLLNLVEHLNENDISDKYLSILANQLVIRLGPWKYNYINKSNNNISIFNILKGIKGCGSNESKQLLINSGISIVQSVRHIYASKVQSIDQSECNHNSIWLLANGANSGLITNTGDFYLWGQLVDQIKSKYNTNYSNEASDDLLVIKNVRGAAIGYDQILILLADGWVISLGDNQFNHSFILPATVPINFCLNDNLINIDVSTPLDLKSDVKIVKLSAGLQVSAALSENGKIYTFMHSKYRCNFQNDVYELSNGLKFIDVECGAKHIIAIDESGVIWSCGDNKYGQLGRILDNNTAFDNSFQLVEGLDTNIRWQRVVSGWSHCIARGVNITGDTIIAVWGRNNFHQCGHNQTSIIPLPMYISSLPNNADIIEIWTGSEYTIVCDEYHQLWGCGWNDHNNLSDSLCCNNNPVWIQVNDDKNKQVVLSSPWIGSVACGGAHILIS